MDNELSTEIYENLVTRGKQAKEEFYLAGIKLGIELLIAKKKIGHGNWGNYLKDVDITKDESSLLMNKAREVVGEDDLNFDHGRNLNIPYCNLIEEMSRREFIKYKKYPKEVKEDVANSKDKEEAEKKIKEYEKQLKEEREAKETVIKNNEELQRQLEREKSTKKVEYRTNEVEVPPNDYDELKYKASQYEEERKKNIELGKKIGEVQNEKTNIRYEYENKMKDIQHKYDEIKKSLEEMNLEEEKLYKYVRQDRDVGQFVGDVQVLLLDRLASFKFSAYLDDDITKYSVDMLAKLINQIRRWCNEMESMLEKYTEEFEEQENRDDGNIIEIENVEVS